MEDLLPTFVPPWFAYVRGTGSYSVAIAAVDGALVLLSPGPDGRVARQIRGAGLDARYVDLRRRLARHVDLPSFEVSEDGRWLVEEFVQGSHLSELALEDQLQVVRRLFDSYRSLVAEEQETGGEAFFDRVRVHLACCELPSDVVGAAAPVLHANDWPLVPSRPGGSVMNLVVATGLRPVQIDLAAVKLTPFFYDPIALILAAGGDVLDRFVAGCFDTELLALFEAADVVQPAPDHRRALLAAACIVRAHLRNPPGPLGDRRGFEHAVLSRWSRVAPLSRT